MMQIAGIVGLCLWAFMALVSLALTIRFVVIMVAAGIGTLSEFRKATSSVDRKTP